MTTRRTLLGTAAAGAALAAGALVGLPKRVQAKENPHIPAEYKGRLAFATAGAQPPPVWEWGRLTPDGRFYLRRDGENQAAYIARIEEGATYLPDLTLIARELQPLLDRGISVEEIAANLRDLSARYMF